MFRKRLKKIIRVFANPLESFLLLESSSTILLFVATLSALFLANSSSRTSYFNILHLDFFGLSVQHWINDGLMTLFFLVVGMEIKKELMVGELATRKKAALPLIAALGGMIVPALFYIYFNYQGNQVRGWGIPMATDIAFALAVLSLGGKRVPLALKVFLLALAIVDDLGAILVIALFYSQGIAWPFLGFAALAMLAIFLLLRWRETSLYFHIPLALAVWIAFLFSGVHATISGVILGLLVPLSLKNKKGQELKPVENFINKLHPSVSLLIMPLFALANAGVTVSLEGIENIIESTIFQGIVSGLVLGKMLGIFGASYLAVRLGVAQLPDRVKWRDIFAVSLLGGVGFTMSLFISALAFSSDLDLYSKSAILVASTLSAILGLFVLILKKREN